MFDTFNSSVTRTVLGAVGTTICAGICLIAAAGPADAAPVRTATVSYADLDVHTATGRAVLDRRVLSAARTVCASAEVGPAARVEEGRCVRHAVAGVKPVIG